MEGDDRDLAAIGADEDRMHRDLGKGGIDPHDVAPGDALPQPDSRDEIDDRDFACVTGDCLSRTLWKSYVGAPTTAPAAAPLPESHLFPIVAEGGESAPCPAPGACPVTHPHIGERERLVDAMERTGWVQAKAARLLGLTPRQIGYALRKHGVEMKRL